MRQDQSLEKAAMTVGKTGKLRAALVLAADLAAPATFR